MQTTRFCGFALMGVLSALSLNCEQKDGYRTPSGKPRRVSQSNPQRTRGTA
jgi:hypothetical protein